MTYASSTAVGALPQHEAAFGGAALPPPPPRRMHWSTLLLVGGLSIAFLALLATLAGVPGRMGYDRDGAPVRSDTNSSNPLKVMQALDGNMKWVAEASGDGAGEYVGYINAINRKEAAIPAMVTALAAMDASVRAIDSGLGSVQATTQQMNADMAAMGVASASSSAAMGELNSSVGLLSKSMLSLATATQDLTKRMSAIEAGAASMSTNGTAGARGIASELNGVLPGEAAAPVFEPTGAAQ